MLIFFSILEFSDSSVLCFHDIYKLKFTDHFVKFEFWISFEELLFLVVYSYSL